MTSLYSFYTAVAVAAVVLALFLRLSTRAVHPRHLPYPPGPKGQLLVGNVLDVPASYPWLTYRDWSKTYGTQSP